MFLLSPEQFAPLRSRAIRRLVFCLFSFGCCSSTRKGERIPPKAKGPARWKARMCLQHLGGICLSSWHGWWHQCHHSHLPSTSWWWVWVGLPGERCHPGCLGWKPCYQAGLGSFQLCLEHQRGRHLLCRHHRLGVRIGGDCSWSFFGCCHMYRNSATIDHHEDQRPGWSDRPGWPTFVDRRRSGRQRCAVWCGCGHGGSQHCKHGTCHQQGREGEQVQSKHFPRPHECAQGHPRSTLHRRHRWCCGLHRSGCYLHQSHCASLPGPTGQQAASRQPAGSQQAASRPPAGGQQVACSCTMLHLNIQHLWIIVVKTCFADMEVRSCSKHRNGHPAKSPRNAARSP